MLNDSLRGIEIFRRTIGKAYKSRYTNDYKYIKLYEDYNKARKTGEKVGYVVAVLAERYQVSERTVYDVVRRFGQDCKSVSV